MSRGLAVRVRRNAVPAGGTLLEELERIVPRYPSDARRGGVAGSVVIRGIVRRDGTIDNVEILKDLPYGMGEAAREAVSRWRFRPATFRGEPIDVYCRVTVNSEPRRRRGIPSCLRHRGILRRLRGSG